MGKDIVGNERLSSSTVLKADIVGLKKTEDDEDKDEGLITCIELFLGNV